MYLYMLYILCLLSKLVKYNLKSWLINIHCNIKYSSKYYNCIKLYYIIYIFNY